MENIPSKDCAICCESLNNSTRKHVPCVKDDCDIVYCKSCVRTYLLGDNKEPHCMKCKSAWGQEHLVKHLNRSFCTKEYKEHRKSVLLEKELGKMPETMNAANRQKEINKLKDKQIAIQAEITKINEILKHHKKNVSQVNLQMYNLQSGRTPAQKKKFIMPCSVSNCRGFLSSAYKCEICEIYTCSDCLTPMGENRNNEEHTCDPHQLENAKYIKETCKACPGMCGEFIYKIDGCDQMWCTTCHTAFSWNTGEIERGVIHNPHYYQAMQNGVGMAPRAPGDVVCGGLPDIYYVISNPYKKFMRQIILLKSSTFEQGTSKTIREIWNYIKSLSNIYLNDLSSVEPDERLNIIKNRLQITDIDLKLMSKYVYYYVQIELVYKEICNLHRIVNHINEVVLPDTRGRIIELQNNESSRVDYILQNINREKLAEDVYRKDQVKQKIQEELYIIELLSACGIDLFRFIVDTIDSFKHLFPLDQAGNLVPFSESPDLYPSLDDATNILDRITVRMNEFKSLCNYCDKEFAKISSIFNKVSFHIEISSYRKIIGENRDTRNLIMRNFFINNDLPFGIKMDIISSCYAFMVENDIIKTNPRISNENRNMKLKNEIHSDHFTYDALIITTKKFKRAEDYQEQVYRKLHLLQ